MLRVGVDLGGTNIVSGVVDESCRIIGRGKLPTACPRAAREIFADAARTVRLAAGDAGIGMDEILSVGVGAPGSVDKKRGVIEYANNLCFDMVPAGELLQADLNKPVYVDNDANCAAFGEAVAGAGAGARSFVAITLGTGVGSGIIIDGKILEGCNGAAGELGHTVIVAGGEPCTCGRRGCWEAYASATALIRQTKEAMRKHPDSAMWTLAGGDIDEVNGRTAFDAMRLGDAAAKEVVDGYIRRLAAGIVNVINIFQPEVLCIGGGIGSEGETLLEPVREIVKKERYSIHSAVQTRICSARLGNDAGIIGAALLGK